MFDLKRPVWPTFMQFLARRQEAKTSQPHEAADGDCQCDDCRDYPRTFTGPIVDALKNKAKRIGVTIKASKPEDRTPYLYLIVNKKSGRCFDRPCIVLGTSPKLAMKSAKRHESEQRDLPEEDLIVYLFEPISQSEVSTHDPNNPGDHVELPINPQES